MTVTKFGNPIRVGSAASDPTAENGAVYYNSTNNILKFRENGAFRTVASREYADSIAAGFSPKNSVRLGTVAVLPDCTYDNGVSGVGATLTADNNGALSVDGVAVAPGDRVLVKNQVAGLQNGIYVVTDEGDGSNPFVLTRSSDFDDSPDGEVSNGAITLVVAGNTLSGQQWFLTTTGSITLGTTALTFSQASGGGGVADLQEAYEADNTITTDAGDGDLIVDGTETLFVSTAGGIRAVLLKTEDGATSDSMAIRTGDGASGISGNMSITTGDSGAGNSGGLDLITGDATGGNGGGIIMRTGDGDISGSVYIGSGPQIASTIGDSGDVTLASGPVNATTLVSGNLLINTGDSDHATGGDSGNLTIRTGESVGANSGNLTISTGDAASGIIGNITIATGTGSSGGDITMTAAQNLSMSSGTDVNITASSNAITLDAGGSDAVISMNASGLGALEMSASAFVDISAGAGACGILLNDASTENVKISTGSGGTIELFGENGVHRSNDNNEYVREDYISNFGLTASTTAVAAELTFDSTNYEGALIDYKIKEATTGRVRVGQLVVATNGTNVVVTDVFAETADVGVTWSVALNGTDVELSYTTTANAKTMQADVKKIAFVA